MSDQLFTDNKLNKNTSGIWVNPMNRSRFDYSDGDAQENYLINLLSKSSDLSLYSKQLHSGIQDWASQYHLSCLRANLLKGLNLPKQARVLEVGCGCGAITRYLGEQGFIVDAIEGSTTRAQIARLRTADLDNVQIIQHNFNSLKLDACEYDVVLFIGVLEYASRFLDDQQLTNEQAVISLIDKASRTLSDSGKIIIAIENRLGLKYQLGAFEDHLAQADAGINNYQGFEDTGIKTFSLDEWERLIEQTRLFDAFYYPFPDYKLPYLCVFDPESKDLPSLMATIKSQDPISPWLSPDNESQRWQYLCNSHELSEQANSFGIILSKQPIQATQIFKSDWALYDEYELCPNFQSSLGSSDQIPTPGSINRINANLGVGDFSQLISLQSLWLKKIMASPTIDSFAQLGGELFKMIKQAQLGDELFSAKHILISDDENSPQVLKSWNPGVKITAQNQLFYCLIDFLSANKKMLSMLVEYKYYSFEMFVKVAFDFAQLNWAQSRAGLIHFQEDISDKLFLRPCNVESILAYKVTNFDRFKYGYVNTELFWANQAGQFSATQCLASHYKQSDDVQSIEFNDLVNEARFLRFDPCDHSHGINHYLSINSILIQTDAGTPIFNLNEPLDLIKHCQFTDMQVIDKDKAVFKIISPDPQIRLNLPNQASFSQPRYNLRVSLQWLGV